MFFYNFMVKISISICLMYLFYHLPKLEAPFSYINSVTCKLKLVLVAIMLFIKLILRSILKHVLY